MTRRYPKRRGGVWKYQSNALSRNQCRIAYEGYYVIASEDDEFEHAWIKPKNMR